MSFSASSASSSQQPRVPAGWKGPLTGIRVLDMSRLLPGPFCSQILCDLGAEVIKIEDFEGGDYARFYPPLMSDGNSAIFHALNRGKKSVQLDLKKQEDKNKFIKLLATADVLLETFRPGVMSKLGFSPLSLQAQFPGLVICSISGYGQSGPDSLRAGHDVNYLAKSGAMGIMAQPKLLPVQVADIAGGSFPAAVQILAALRQKDKTGKGSIIDVSMSDNVYALMVMTLARYDASKEKFSQGRDWLVGGTPCYEMYQTSDGFISVGALEPKFWSSFCKSLNHPEWIPLQFPDTPEEVQKVKQLVQGVLSTRSNRDWKEFFKNKDCCVEVVELPENLSATDPHLSAREVDLHINFAGSDKESLRVAKTPLCMSGLKLPDTPGPKLGQHNVELLSKL